jgi:two-component system cell cycle response regulator
LGLYECSVVNSRVRADDQDTIITDIGKPALASERSDCLIVIHDPKQVTLLGKRLDLADGITTIGRDASNHLTLDEPAVSREHARIELTSDGCALIDCSTNGTLVNDAVVHGRLSLSHGDNVRVGSVVLKFLTASNVESAYHEEIFRSITTDYLTSLATRKIFEDALSGEITRAHRHNRPLSMVMVDVDFFKKVNDGHGHDAGDAVLAHIGRLLKAAVRESDVAGRLGGEELGILMPETRLQDAVVLAERVRESLAAVPITLRTATVSVTASFGCATLLANDDASALFRRADEKLYEAKHAGRNCVRF